MHESRPRTVSPDDVAREFIARQIEEDPREERDERVEARAAIRAEPLPTA